MSTGPAPPSLKALTGARRTRVLVIANHLIVRAGLRAILGEAAALELVGETHAREPDCRAAIAASVPDVGVVDVDPLDERGTALVRQLTEAPAGPGILVLTGDGAAEHQESWLRSGARGLVLKDAPAEVLARAIRQVSLGELWFERKLLTSELIRPTARVADLHADRFAALTTRERQIVMLVAEGLRNEQVSARLGVAEKTVRNRLSAIFDHLGVNDRLGLVVYAYQHRLVRLPATPAI